jgi:parvulin-like peptidyl-prolyl isomerase
VLSSRELTAWAFDNEKGAAVRKDVKYYGMVVAQITESREVGIKPFEDMKEKLTLTLRQQKKLDKLAQDAKALAASFGTDTTMGVTSQSGMKNNGSITGFGGEYAATNAAFTAPVGTVTGPIRGERAWFVLKVVSRTDANMQQFAADRTAVMQNLSTRTRNQAFYAWFQALRENSEIEDLRNKRN